MVLDAHCSGQAEREPTAVEVRLDGAVTVDPSWFLPPDELDRAFVDPDAAVDQTTRFGFLLRHHGFLHCQLKRTVEMTRMWVVLMEHQLCCYSSDRQSSTPVVVVPLVDSELHMVQDVPHTFEIRVSAAAATARTTPETCFRACAPNMEELVSWMGSIQLAKGIPLADLRGVAERKLRNKAEIENVLGMLSGF